MTGRRIDKDETIHDAQSRKAVKYLMKMVNEHESPTELLLNYRLNTFQMLPRYHAESAATAGDVKVRKNSSIWR